MADYVVALGMLMLLIATAGSVILVKQRHAQVHERPIQVKAVLFGLYFWGLIFLQLLLSGLAYSLFKS